MIHNKTHDSSMIKSSNYNDDNFQLSITFNSGITYLYEGVSNEDYTEFINGESAGKSFNDNIRKYHGTKVVEDLLIEIDDANLRLGYPSNIEGSEEFFQANQINEG